MSNKAENLYEEALRQMKGANPDLEKVSLLLTSSHNLGNKKATYALATWYLHGTFYKKDERKSFELLKIAVEDYITDAHYDIAISYETGVGVKIDEAKAFKHYLIAALWGDKQSMFEVGRCFYYGIGISRNKKVADIWFDKAETLGIIS